MSASLNHLFVLPALTWTGALTNANWRWCFAINLPICLAAILLIIFVLRKELLGPQPLPGLDEQGDLGRVARFGARVATIDSGGQLLFLFGFGLIILAFTWAGVTYDWNTAAVLVSLVGGIALVCLFIFYERLMFPGRILARKWPYQKPMVSWKLLITKDTGLLFYINFATGAAMYAVLYFCNLYFTLCKVRLPRLSPPLAVTLTVLSRQGFGPAKAGQQLLYYTPGLGGEQLCRRGEVTV